MFNMFKPKKTLDEVEEENELKEAELRGEELQLSIEQRRKLRDNGLKQSDFGGNIRKLVTWFKEH
jgi:hypothetical protein